MVVDSHCHASALWFEPVETLLHQMDRNGVAQAVLIQIRDELDNAYQQDCLRRFPGRFASVVSIDASRADAADTLKRLADDGATGVRLRIAEPSPGPDKWALWRLAAALGLGASCPGSSAAFASPEFAALVESLPNLPIAVEHMGAAAAPDADAAAAGLRRRVLDLARFPNVHLKLHGVGELSPRRRGLLSPAQSPFEPATPPILREALQRFGAGRLMWGSDFPPVAGREGYANALNWPCAMFADLPRQDQDAIFGDNARRVFRLP